MIVPLKKIKKIYWKKKKKSYQQIRYNKAIPIELAVVESLKNKYITKKSSININNINYPRNNIIIKAKIKIVTKFLLKTLTIIMVLLKLQIF